MKAQVKSIISPDVSDFKKYYPDDETTFAFVLELTVGLCGEEGGDQFQIEVCTPKWIITNNKDSLGIFGRHKLIVFKYDIDSIINQITKYCESCNGDSWEEIASKISRIAHWEFEDYQK